MQPKYLGRVKIIALLLFFLGVSPLRLTIAKEKKEEVSPGTEVIKVGKTKIVVPQGARVRRERNLIVVEDMNLYVARRLSEFEERLNGLQEREAWLRKEVERLRKKLDKAQENTAGPKD